MAVCCLTWWDDEMRCRKSCWRNKKIRSDACITHVRYRTPVTKQSTTSMQTRHSSLSKFQICYDVCFFKLWIQLGNLFWSLPEDRLTSFQVQRSKLYCLVAQWWSGEHLKHALMSLCWQETDILWLKIIKSSFSFNMGFKVIRINNVLLVDKVLNSVLVVWYLVSPTVLQY